jgi:hypothetical protein
LILDRARCVGRGLFRIALSAPAQRHHRQDRQGRQQDYDFRYHNVYMLVVDEFASVKAALKSTVDFVFDLLVSRLMSSSTCEIGANRTFMLVIVGGMAGLPFE